MSRHAARKPAGAHVFPFLAVLICTMGALVMLLVVIARNTRANAVQQATIRAEHESADDQIEQADIQWRIDQLRQSREKTATDLEEQRLVLSQVEDHLRRLRREARRLQLAADEMQKTTAAQHGNRSDFERELEALRREAEAARRDLAEAEREAASRPTSYTVVPYAGPNHTRRRPVYIECRADAVVLQPEGIVLRESDFSGSLGPGNPLAASLRAIREYLASQTASGDTQEPYPLLLVRPDGIAAYYVAREALSSWGAEFGYELVGQNWELEYPEPDPQLEDAARQTIADARVRLGQQLRAAPGHFARQERPKFTVASNGGVKQIAGVPAMPNKGPGGGTGGTLGSGSGGGTGDGSDFPSNGSGGASSPSKRRGHGWGLPDASAGSVAVTRPILVVCRNDRLIVGAEDYLGAGKEIPLGAKTADSVDDLVSSVWQHMKTWGIAGKNMHWKPTLVFDVAPDAAHRYAELATLLAESGLDVRQKETVGLRQHPKGTRANSKK